MVVAIDDLVIRPEVASDHDGIRRVVAAAFGQADEADLVDRIRDSAGYIPALALVAETSAGVCGHVIVSRAKISYETGERGVAMLSPLAVHPDFQRQGIGAKLVAAVVVEANRMGEPFVVLEGSPVYYGRLGFEPASKYGMQLPLPSWAPTEAAQLLALDGFDPTDQTMRGVVVYPPAFDGLD